MRIAYVTSHYPPSRGGIETHVSQLAVQARLRGHEVEVFTATRGDLTPGSDEVTVHRFPSRGPTAALQFPRGLVAALRRRADRFDLVHAHNYHGVAALMASSAWDGPFVFTPHFHGEGHTALANLAHRPYRIFARRLFRRTDQAICVTAAEERLLMAAFPEVVGRTRVIPNGVDVDRIRAAAPFPKDRPVVLVVGRFDAYKRVDVALRAFSRLGTDADLVLIGQGAQEAALRRLVAELGISERVRFLSGLPIDELHRWLRTADLAFTLSLHEAFGLALAEALAGGAKVVASDIPAHREVAGASPAEVHLVSTDADVEVVARAARELLSGERGLDVPLPGIASWADVAERTFVVYAGAVGDATSS
jgi:glycosyltransferase involved in cell wall biosynthesis